jgi:hypothetical protein
MTRPPIQNLLWLQVRARLAVEFLERVMQHVAALTLLSLSMYSFRAVPPGLRPFCMASLSPSIGTLTEVRSTLVQITRKEQKAKRENSCGARDVIRLYDLCFFEFFPVFLAR